MKKILIPISVFILCILVSCVNKIEDTCKTIKMYKSIHIVFGDSNDFKYEPIDSIQIGIKNSPVERDSIILANIIKRKSDNIKATYTLEIDNVIGQQTEIELELNNKLYQFTKFNFRKQEIKHSVGWGSYETCLLKGCEINGNYTENLVISLRVK